MKKNKLPFKRLRHALTVPVVKLVVFSASISPAWLSAVVARFLGYTLAALPLPSNTMIKKNAARVVLPDGKTPMPAAVYEAVLVSYFDFFRLSGRSDRFFLKQVQIRGKENIERALSHKKGVIAVTAHYGAWELLPRAVKLLGFEISVVGRSLPQKNASDILDSLRQKPGVTTIDRDAGAAPIVRRLRENGIVGMLIDQATKGVQSEYADFLGLQAPTPVAPALFARKLRSPVVTMHITRKDRGTYLLEIDEPVFFSEEDEVGDVLTELNRRISEWILDAPEQWVWFHNRWRKIK